MPTDGTRQVEPEQQFCNFVIIIEVGYLGNLLKSTQPTPGSPICR